MGVPTSFTESNTSFGPPKGMTEDDVGSLSVWKGTYQDGRAIVISCWKFTAEELEEIKRTGRVWVHIWGNGLPPIYVSGTTPFKTP